MTPRPPYDALPPRNLYALVFRHASETGRYHLCIDGVLSNLAVDLHPTSFLRWQVPSAEGLQGWEFSIEGPGTVEVAMAWVCEGEHVARGYDGELYSLGPQPQL